MHVIGVDLGGTNIKAGVVGESGNVVTSVSFETEADLGPDHVIDRMALSANQARMEADLEWSQIPAVGVGAPGPLNCKQGIVIMAPNLSGWENIHVSEKMQERLHVQTFLENDANAAAFGEYWVGAGTGAACMIQLTLGTGVGGGIVMNGQVWRGPDDCAGELGHVPIRWDGARCGCGASGCVEAYASATALVRIAQEKLDAGAKSSISDRLRYEPLTAKLVADEAHAGDDFALAIYREVGTYLGVAIAGFVNIFNPDKVVISGGMAQAGEILFGPIREEVTARAMAPATDRVEIVPAILGADAGVIGAAGCALQRLKEE